MHTLTAEDFERQPLRLLDEAQRGQTNMVTRDGMPVLLAVPLDASAGSQRVRLEVAVSLYDQGQISLGQAAGIAGVPYGDMINELGRRGIATVRYSADELAQELDYVRSLAGGR